MLASLGHHLFEVKESLHFQQLQPEKTCKLVNMPANRTEKQQNEIWSITTVTLAPLQELEVQQLKAAEMANQRMQVQLDAAASEQKELQHRHELVLMDKAYLSKQVEGLEDRLRKTDTELEAQHAKVAELKRARQELHQKLYEAGASRHDQVGILLPQ